MVKKDRIMPWWSNRKPKEGYWSGGYWVDTSHAEAYWAQYNVDAQECYDFYEKNNILRTKPKRDFVSSKKLLMDENFTSNKINNITSIQKI